MTSCRDNGLVSLVSHPEDPRIGVLRMRDEASRNSFTESFVEGLTDQLSRAAQDQSLHVLVLCGLPDIFCTGAAKETLTSIKAGRLRVKNVGLPELLLQLEVPTIAAMRGAAIGGGLVLGLLCDIVLMSDRRMYGANFTSLGFTPGMGCTTLLQSLVGEYVAAEMMFRGRLFKGRTFRERSLVNHVLPDEQVEVMATEIALDIAEKPRVTLQLLKNALSAQRRQALLKARVQEDLMHRISFAHADIDAAHGPMSLTPDAKENATHPVELKT